MHQLFPKGCGPSGVVSGGPIFLYKFRMRLNLRFPSWLLGAMLFAAAYTQSPLFFSNQNQYFLHGIADAGVGHLSHDWLANTRDPTPAFSLFVQLAFRWNIPEAIFVCYALVMIGYVYSLATIVDHFAWFPKSSFARWAFLCGTIFIHSAIARWLSVQVAGVDYPWYFQCGVAGQYVLGAGLQPSVFGVLMVASIAAFVSHRQALAIALLWMACGMHTTYLLPCAMLILGYSFANDRSGERRKAWVTLAVGLFGLAIVGTLALSRFAPSDAVSFASGQKLLAETRIPHHSIVNRWLDPIAGLQCVVVLIGIACTRGSRLFPVLCVAAICATIGTAFVAITGHPTVALMFPWRISAVLVPLSVSFILARLISRWNVADSRSRIAITGLVLVSLCLAVSGIALNVRGIGYAMNEAERPVLEFVRSTSTANDVYLIPTRIPKLSGARGSVSTTFTPPPRPKPGATLIPVDFQRFRLMTGTAIFVDFKSVPYADREVLEWHRRMKLCENWYDGGLWNNPEAAAELIREGITHAIVSREQKRLPEPFQPIYEEEAFTVYRLGRSRSR